MLECSHGHDKTVTILVLIFCIICLIIIGVAILLNRKHQKYLEELMRYQVNVTSNIDKSIPEILDLIIQESFTDYRIKHLEPLNDGFINSEREIEIRKDLIEIVTVRISGAALDKLSLFYNINNIADILADKIYICVMNYVIDHNIPYISD